MAPPVFHLYYIFKNKKKKGKRNSKQKKEKRRKRQRKSENQEGAREGSNERKKTKEREGRKKKKTQIDKKRKVSRLSRNNLAFQRRKKITIFFLSVFSYLTTDVRGTSLVSVVTVVLKDIPSH